MITIIIFLLVLAVLIFVHELGHFLMARAAGIRVDAFALGFGPKIFSWKKGGTLYSLNLIPFGGYVKIFGENPDEASTTGPDAHRSFVNKPRFVQGSVLIAGVLFNFLFAWLLYVIIFTSGITATIDGFEKYQDRFENQRIMITHVSPGSPAERAGVKTGDVLTGGQSIEQIQGLINDSNGKPVTLRYERRGIPADGTMIPVTGLVVDKYAVGIAMDNVVDLRLPVWTSFYEGFRYMLIMIRETAVGLYEFFSTIFRGTADFAAVAGPVGIAGIVGDAAGLGFTYLLMITALISINLGVINLIPFPALDGGRLLFVIIESFIRRRIPAVFTNTVNVVGFALLMLLMVIVTYKDIAKLVG